MKAMTFVARVALMVYGLLAIATQERSEAAGRRKLVLKTVFGTAVAIGLLSAAGGLVFIYSGFYYIAANEPHSPIVRWVLTTVARESVERYSTSIQPRSLNEPALVRRGLAVYRDNCLPCHGAPGVAREQLGRGINPSPPPLMSAAPNWTDAQLYWIATYGLKMSGMPAFRVKLSDDDRWAVVAFVREMVWLSPKEYQRRVAAVEGNASAEEIDWVQDDHGMKELSTRGDPEHGRVLVTQFGCGGCHVLAEIGTAGRVGPPLTRYAERHYIAGAVVNSPNNLAAWIVNPKAIEPNTAMPNLGVTRSEALDITAFLYTLGDGRRLDSLRERLKP